MFNNNRHQLILILSLWIAISIVSGCERQGSTDGADQTAASKDSATINWFDGSVEAAFDRARAKDKPLFLYWGAVWCPPCEEIKQTVFKSPDFIAQSRLFVPVYLDGDTQRAQTWGEKFAVQGYPTMIVFNAEGEEVTRLPGGIDIDRYNQVLQLSLDNMTKITELIERAREAPSSLSTGDYTRLAYYSWDQANLPEGTYSGDLLARLADGAAAAGNPIASTRLSLTAVTLHIENDQPMSMDEKATSLDRLKAMLGDPQLAIANHDFSMFWSREITENLTDPGEQRRQLAETWGRTMAEIRDHSSLSKAEQLGSWYPRLHLYWLTHPEEEQLPPQLAQEVRDHIARLDENTRGSARQTVMNKAYQVLQAAHLYEESKDLLLAELDKAPEPYYFMSGLASLAKEQGKPDEAVSWLARAYDAAEGEATRFQWGVEYVVGMVELQPDKQAPIVRTTQSLLDELASPQDVFVGRNYRRLQTLNDALQSWGDSHPTAGIKAFYRRLADLCNETAAESAARKNCQSLELSKG